jgi:3-oxoacyl-[acyl-carrier protein] reductase
LSEKQEVFVVLGGSGYVGQAVVRLLRSFGRRVMFSYGSNTTLAQKLADETGAESFHFAAEDVAAAAGVATQFEGQAVGALINCLGVAGDPALYQGDLDGPAKFQAIDLAGWHTMQNVSVTSFFAMCQALSPCFAKPANVVVVGSMDGVKSVPAPVHYAAAKAALSGMVRALGKALGPQGVCVNMIAAGILEGGIGKLLSPKLREQYLKHCALKRFGTAEEVAALAVWLAVKNRYINGQSIVMDGGL